MEGHNGNGQMPRHCPHHHTKWKFCVALLRKCGIERHARRWCEGSATSAGSSKSVGFSATPEGGVSDRQLLPAPPGPWRYRPNRPVTEAAKDSGNPACFVV